jgi:hypothetical protein
MRGIYAGLKLAIRKGVTLSFLIDMVTGRCILNGATPILIRRIQEFISMDWQTQFQHKWREGNRSANWLANHSLMQ